MRLKRSSMWHLLPWLLSLSLGVAPGCDGGDGKGQPDASNDADAGAEQDASEPDPEEDAAADEEDAGGSDAGVPANGKGRVRGRVTYADGTAVGQVEISVGNKKVKSDSRGVFSADDLPEGELEVSVENAGTSRAQLKVDTREDRVTQAELFVLPLKKNGIARADEASEISAEGVKLRFPKGGLRIKGTQEAASGAADGNFAVVKDSRDLKAAPGRLKGSKDGRDVDLDCFGMIDVHLSQGERELELSQDAELDLPLGPNSFADGQEVEAWSFDVASGKWKSENRAVVDKSEGGNGVAKVKATHFSWWTIAQPVAEQTCISGRLASADAKPLPYLWVQSVAASYWGTTWAQTDADGRFCLSVRQGSSQSVSAFG
ncbi:MAG TPA: carboxypeptidase-like regulatory domain-containing protein, partial [Polyangiales bacterium]